MWASMGGSSNPYPTPQQFEALRRASELPVLSRVNFTVTSTPMVLETTLPQPAVSLFHICSLAANSDDTSATPPLAPSAVSNVSVRATPTVNPPTVFVRWDAPAAGSGCIQTYEVMYSPTRTGEFRRVNDDDTIFLAFVHAQASSSSSSSSSSPSLPSSSPSSSSWRGPGRTVWPALGARPEASGCYAVRAVSVWGGVGVMSDPVCLPTRESLSPAVSTRR